MNKSIKLWIAVTLITLLGFALRIYQIDKFPPSLNWDEVSHGYNAYSILKTGADEWGMRFPLIFRAFGDYKLPVYIYLTVIPVWLFGLSAFSVRLVSVLAGTLAIPGIFLLARELISGRGSDPKVVSGLEKGSDPIGLVSAFLLAICPWHFFISRPALEANLALTFAIFGAYFLLKGLRHHTSLIWGSIFFALTMHTYNTYRVFTPLLLLGFIGIFRKKLFKNSKLKISHLASAIILILASALVGYQIYNHTGTARYGKLSILSDNAIYNIGQSRANSKLPSFVSKLVYNRPVYFVSAAGLNYINYFSPQFFYQTMGVQDQFAIPYKNILGLPILFLAVVGLILLLPGLKATTNRFVLFWLLISPIAAALTADPPQALRPTPMIVALIVLATFGLLRLCQFLADTLKLPKLNYIFVAYFLIICAVAFGRYIQDYFTNYTMNYSFAWQYGYSQAISYLKDHQNEYDRVFITKGYGEPHIFYAFYTHLDPKVLQSGANTIRFTQSNWYWTDRIDNVYFVNDWLIPEGTPANSLKLESGGVISTQKSLLITTPAHLPSNAVPVKTIDFLDGELDLVIAKFK